MLVIDNTKQLQPEHRYHPLINKLFESVRAALWLNINSTCDFYETYLEDEESGEIDPLRGICYHIKTNSFLRYSTYYFITDDEYATEIEDFTKYEYSPDILIISEACEPASPYNSRKHIKFYMEFDADIIHVEIRRCNEGWNGRIYITEEVIPDLKQLTNQV